MILRDVAAVGVQNVHVMHLTSREGIFRGVDPLLLVRQAFRRAGGTQKRLCAAAIGQADMEANGGVGEASGQPEVHPPGPGLTFAKLAECQYVMEALGDLPLRVAYERLAALIAHAR